MQENTRVSGDTMKDDDSTSHTFCSYNLAFLHFVHQPWRGLIPAREGASGNYKQMGPVRYGCDVMVERFNTHTRPVD